MEKKVVIKIEQRPPEGAGRQGEAGVAALGPDRLRGSHGQEADPIEGNRAELPGARRGVARGKELAPEDSAVIREEALEILRKEFPPAAAPAPVPRSMPSIKSIRSISSTETPLREASAEAGPAAKTISEPLPAPPDPAPSARQSLPPALPQAKASSESLPARMLNEFVYCPRLFYYEYVEGVFVESADTLRGAAIHQRVDSGSGAMPGAKAKSASAPEPVKKRGKAAGKSKDDASGAPAAEKETGAEPLNPPAPCAMSGPLGTSGPATGPDGALGTAGPTQELGTAHPSVERNEPEVIHSRSVQMGSAKLGVVAKMDLVESRGPSDDLFSALVVCPVDYKAGAPKEGEEGNELWDTDKIQLGLQALILRENGYNCDEGIIYYRATKQRVRLPITPGLEQWIGQKIAEARETIRGPIPPPLRHSPKCVRCSLAPVCLPDETALLSARFNPPDDFSKVGRAVPSAPDHIPPTSFPNQSDSQPSAAPNATLDRDSSTAPPRRLIAARDDTRVLYLNTPGLRIGCKEETLQVKERDKVIDEVRMRDVAHVALFGNIQITTQAVQALCELEIPVTYFSMGGWFYGITRGHGLKNVFLRMEQFRLAREEPACLALARQFVHGKIRNHRTLLMRNHAEPPESVILKLKRASEDALDAGSAQELLGMEGAAASLYFGQFNGMIKVEDALAAGSDREQRAQDQLTFNFNFNHRNRRPPTDPVNAMLSLAYSMLSKDCTLAALAVGFDPYIGFYHQPRFGRPALGLDLMEEFRPLIAESTVLNCINNRIITEKDFVRAGDSVNLNPAGRKKFFQAYEQRMTSLITHPLFDYKVTYRRALELQARLLGKTLTGEIHQYTPMLTR